MCFQSIAFIILIGAQPVPSLTVGTSSRQLLSSFETTLVVSNRVLAFWYDPSSFHKILPQIFVNKQTLSKFDNVIGFIKQFMNGAPCFLAGREVLQGLYKVEGFYSKESRARKLSARKNENSLEKRKSLGDGFSLAELHCFHWQG